MLYTYVFIYYIFFHLWRVNIIWWTHVLSTKATAKTRTKSVLLMSEHSRRALNLQMAFIYLYKYTIYMYKHARSFVCRNNIQWYVFLLCPLTTFHFIHACSVMWSNFLGREIIELTSSNAHILYCWLDRSN